MVFLELFDKYIEYYSNATNKRDRRDPDTIRSYKNRGDLIGCFLWQNDLLDLKPEQFRPVLADQYFEHLCKQEYAHNWAIRCVDICKAVLRFGVRKELIQVNPLSEYSLEKEPAPEPLHLTLDELIAIRNFRPVLDCLKKAKDMFLFQCLTGLDYGDTMTFSERDIQLQFGKLLIIKARDKTGVESIIPIQSEVIRILKRNNFNMALLSNARYNKYLKSIAAFCKIKKHLTSKVARKTYGMMELEGGISIEALSRRLGHRYISTTEASYVRTNLMVVLRELARREGRKGDPGTETFRLAG
jgi:site-specific recombinase XerD